MATHTPKKVANKTPPASNLHATLSDPTINLHSHERENLKDIFVNMGRRTRRRLDDDVYEQNDSGGNTLLSEITQLFSEFEQKQNRKFDGLRATMSDILNQNSKIQDSIAFMSEKYDEILDRLQTTERDNSILKKKVISLEAKINHLERNSRSALIEVTNLPIDTPESKETLTKSLCKIGTVINQPIQPTDVKNVFRMKPKKDSKSVGTVVAELNSSTLKEQYLIAARLHNKQNPNAKLSTKDLKAMGPPSPMYISESLTTYDKHLFYQGRKLQKEGKCESCWSSHGKIYIKKSPGSTPQCINTENELLNFISSAK